MSLSAAAALPAAVSHSLSVIGALGLLLLLFLLCRDDFFKQYCKEQSAEELYEQIDVLNRNLVRLWVVEAW